MENVSQASIRPLAMSANVPGLHLMVEQGQSGRRIVAAGLRKQMCPRVFGIPEHRLNELSLPVFG